MGKILGCMIICCVLFLSIFPQQVKGETLGVQVLLPASQITSWPDIVPVVIEFTVENTGETTDWYLLNVTDDLGWNLTVYFKSAPDIQFPPVFNIIVGVNRTLEGSVHVIIPSDTAHGIENRINVSTTSLTDPLVYDEKSCSVNVFLSGVMVEEPTYLDLPEGAIALGIVYDEVETVYTVSYWRGSILAINTSSLQYEEYFVTGSQTNELGLFGLTMDVDGNLWFTERSDHKIGKFDPLTKTFEEFATAAGTPVTGIIYNPFDGQIWFTNAPYLSKIDPSSEEITNYLVETNPFALSLDSSGDIWASDLGIPYVPRSGKIFKFDIELETVTAEVHDFDRASGICVKGDLIYVAENSRPCEDDPGCEYVRSGAIPVYNITSGEITRYYTRTIQNEGPYSVFIDRNETVWFSANDLYSGVIGSPTFGTDTFSYFMTQVEEEIWLTGDSRITRMHTCTADLFSTKLSSPADLYIEDPLGRAVGVDPISNAEVNEIPGAIYTGRYSEPEFITIQNPMLDTYNISVIGTATGVVTLTVTRTIGRTTTTIETFAGVTAEDAICTYTTAVTENTASTTSPESPTLLENLKAYINALPNEAFVRNPDQLKNAMNSKIDEAILKIQSEDFEDAINKLAHDIYPKVTGAKYDYYSSGGTKAWIIDPQIQQPLQTYLQRIIEQIRARML